MRWRKLLVQFMAIAALMLAGSFSAWYWWETGSLSGVPEPDQVLTMQAALYGSSRKSPEVHLFNVPPEHFAPILASLRPYVRDPNPAAWQVLGELHLTCRGRRHYQVDLYSIKHE
jgi:hypothetical protein